MGLNRTLLSFLFLLLIPSTALAKLERFTYRNPDAIAVYWSGEANQWKEKSHPMKKDSEGIWVIEINLPAGKQQYKFIVDGKWIKDPEAMEVTGDAYLNSIRLVEDGAVPSAQLPTAAALKPPASTAVVALERFTYRNPDAVEVFWTGQANQWKEKSHPMKKDSEGVWVIEINMAAGKQPYKFIVDGKWIKDPEALEVTGDEYSNSIRLVKATEVPHSGIPPAPASNQPTPVPMQPSPATTQSSPAPVSPTAEAFAETVPAGMYTFRHYAPNAGKVNFASNIIDWNQKPMVKGADGFWSFTTNLEPGMVPAGIVQYKFVVDGEYILDPRNPCISLDPVNGISNSAIAIARSGGADSSRGPLELPKSILPPIPDSVGGGLFIFKLFAPSANKVQFVSSYTNWKPLAMTKSAEGIWTFPTNLFPGEVEYMFVVEDRWIFDPANPRVTELGDFGQHSVLEVTRSMNSGENGTVLNDISGDVLFRVWAPDAAKVFVSGTFNAWSQRVSPMVRRADGVWEFSTRLKPGETKYKFIVDGHWTTDMSNPPVSGDTYQNSCLKFVEKVVADTAGTGVPHTFVYDPFALLPVMVGGSFNNWTPAFATPSGNGDFEYTTFLPQGVTEYKFYVNGAYVAGENSKIEVLEKEGRTYTFRYQTPKPKTVQLAASFNGWKNGLMPMIPQPDGTWSVTRLLPAGRHQYKFIVDDNDVWTQDVSNPDLDPVTGNSVLTIGEQSDAKKLAGNVPALDRRLTIRYQKPGATEVAIVGAMTRWRVLPMDRLPKGDWVTTFNLGPGNYPYILIVDGKAMNDPENPQKMSVYRGSDIQMSMLAVKDPTRIVQALIDDGKELRLLSDYDGAIEKFQQVIANYATFSPAAPRALNYIGLCLMDELKFDLAVQKFQKIIQNYPEARAECAEAHLNLAASLKSLGKTAEARSTIQRLKNNFTEMTDLIRAADDLLIGMPVEITARTEEARPGPGDLVAASTTSVDADAVSLTLTGLDQVFPAMSAVYADQSPGAVVIENKSGIAIEDATLQFVVADIMDFPAERKIALIPAHSTHREPIYPVFNSRILDLTELSTKQSSITLRFSSAGRPVEKRQTANLTFRGRNDIVWDTPAKLAAFITYNDNPVRDFARKTLQLFAEDQNPFPTENFAKSVRLFDALGAYGISYIRDPNTPFDKIYGNASTVDRVQFPRETLRIKNGDCDDLTTLYSAVLENVGVKTRMITVPGHIFLAFESGGTEEDMAQKVQNRDLLMVDSGVAWIPVEITMFGRSFTEAWREASKEVAKYKSAPADIQVLEVAEAWKVYKPCALGSTSWVPDVPAKTSILALLAKDDLNSRKKAETFNKAGTVFAKMGLLDEAYDNFKKSLDIFPDFSDARNNLANVYVLQGKYNEAIVEYKVSLSLKPDQAGVRFNLAIAYNAIGNFDGSREEYAAAKLADPTLFNEEFEAQVQLTSNSQLRGEGMANVQKWKPLLRWMQ